jgi:hypothetical protein
MHLFGRTAIAVVCACLWLATATGVAEAARANAGLHSDVRSMGGAAPALSCSTALHLYDGTGFTGSSVSIFERGVWINFSTLGFDNRTSSYRTGACSVDMASGPNGGGALYPTCHNPGCAESSMAPGWDNVISSVFLH